MKVLTHRPRYIEPAMVPEFDAGTSSTAETKGTAPTTQSTEEPAVMPKVPTVKVAETKVDKAEGLEIEEIMKMPKTLSPPTKATVPKVQIGSSIIPRGKEWLMCWMC
jgi:pyruvate carboxylase